MDSLMSTNGNKLVFKQPVRLQFEDIDIAAVGEHRVRINSEQAQYALGYNTDNRNLRKTYIEHLLHLILSGQWRDDHPASIVFSRDSVLLDGQHRLTAISRANLVGNNGVMLRIITGADPSVQEHIDCGLGRTMNDRLTLSGIYACDRLAVQCAAFYERFNNALRGRITPVDVKAYYENHKEYIHLVASIRKNDKGTGQAAVSSAVIEYMRHDIEKAMAFYTDLFISAGYIQQSQKLRDHLLRQKFLSGLSAQTMVYKCSLYCMRQHSRDKQVTRISPIDSWNS